MKNADVASIFRRIAQILQIQGGNVFRIRAYERAAQNIEGLSRDIADLAHNNQLHTIPGIGKDLAEKISAFVLTGTIPLYEELKKGLPEGVLELLDIPSVGPKTAKLLHENLGVRNIDDLRQAIGRGTLEGVPGIQAKTVENIRRGIALVERGRERMTLAEATALADEFTSALSVLPFVSQICAAGSLRRQKETVRDIDILVTSPEPRQVMDAFVAHPSVSAILAHGETKSSVRTSDDVQVDCRVVRGGEYGAALLYFTGSRDFNIRMRQLAVKRKLKINEYGVFRGGKFLCGKTEQDIFRLFRMAYIEPELREDTGEVQAALKGALPRLITERDIRGDLHVHSRWSDGNKPIAEMAEAARKRGYEYIAITDHSEGLKIARGIPTSELKKKKKEIERLNADRKDFRILMGTEVDIRNDGSLDYPDEALQDCDIVVAAMHGGFKQTREQLTRRLVTACRNKRVHVIAHPTGRLWGEREACDIDFDEVLRAAADTNTHLEINSFPQRLDLNDAHARAAAQRGVKLAISTDSHDTAQLDNIRYGLAVARRAWLQASDVINTCPLEKLLQALKK